jgi:hypothetical protein
LEQRREARLDVFVISIGPPLLVENNKHIGKLRALEVRLVREVKVLNQFFAANVNAFERYMKAQSTLGEWTHSTRDPKNGLSGCEHSRLAVVQSTDCKKCSPALERIAQINRPMRLFLCFVEKILILLIGAFQ